ncbi:hypothetical protein ACI782_02835 [Geodermatophilus sp. SYSU D00703]
MNWGTIAIAALGLLTTLTAPLLQNWVAAKRERATWRRDKATAAYTDAMAYVQTLETMLERVTDPYATAQTRPELAHVDLITAQMRMFAPGPVFDAWKALLRTEEVLRWNIEQEFPGLGHYQGEAVPDDHKDVVQLRTDIHRFYDVVRKVIGS